MRHCPCWKQFGTVPKTLKNTPKKIQLRSSRAMSQGYDELVTGCFCLLQSLSAIRFSHLVTLFSHLRFPDITRAFSSNTKWSPGPSSCPPIRYVLFASRAWRKHVALLQIWMLPFLRGSVPFFMIPTTLAWMVQFPLLWLLMEVTSALMTVW